MPASASAPLVALASTGYSFTLEIRATRQAVTTLIGSLPEPSDELARAVRGAAPDWEVAPADPPVPPDSNWLRHLARLQRQAPIWTPLCTLDAFEVDPLASLLEAAPIAADEQLLIRFLLRPAPADLVERFLPRLTRALPPTNSAELVGWMFGAAPRVPSYAPKVYQAILERLERVRFELLGAVALAGRDPRRLESLARSLTTAIRARQDDLELGRWTWWANPETLPSNWPNGARGLLLTPDELATLWHPPSAQVRLPGISFAASQQQSLLPTALVDNGGVLLGLHHTRGEQLPVRLPLRDLQLGHAILLGKTRVGKTTLAHQVTAQVKQLLPDSSLIVIDPNGDWALDYAARSVRADRVHKTYLIEFGDPELPPSLPILTPPPGVSIDAFTKLTFETIKLIFREHWSSTRMETIMFRTVASLVQLPGSTLLDVERLYTDTRFRQQVTQRVRDPDLRTYWRSFDRLSPGQQIQMTEPILNRLSVFTRSGAIRNITCRPERIFDIGGLIEEGVDVLISTAGAEIHDEADLLVELLISRIHLAMFARLGRSGTRSPVFLAIDESQHVKGPSLPVLLSEAAKTGLCVIALSQYLDQWSPELARSILGNVGTTIVFAVGPNDSATLARTIRPFSAHDAEDQDRFQALVKMRLDGASVPTFDVRTLPLERPADLAVLKQIREQSRARFTLPVRHQRSAPDLVEEVVDIFEE